MNNMGKESFMDSDEGLPKIVTASKSAFIEEDLFIRHSEEYQNCRIEFIPWDRKYGSVSIPITKSSPYEPFMRQVIADVYSTGALKKLQQKWLKTEHQCEKPDVKPISPYSLRGLASPGHQLAVYWLSWYKMYQKHYWQ